MLGSYSTNQGARVLVAEDNPAIAGVLDFSLRRIGCHVEICSNGAKAIAALQSQRFDILITDYQMPGADGIEVIEAARGNEQNADVEIIFCSAKGLECDVDALRAKYRLAATISKPFSPREIMRTIESLNISTAATESVCCIES